MPIMYARYRVNNIISKRKHNFNRISCRHSNCIKITFEYKLFNLFHLSHHLFPFPEARVPPCLLGTPVGRIMLLMEFV